MQQEEARHRARAVRPEGLVAAAAAVAVTTGIAHVAFGPGQHADVVMLYMLAIVLVSMRGDLGASLLASLLSVAAFDFVFVPPRRTFAVSDVRHIVTFAVMFFVGITISALTRRVRDQARAAHERELRVEREVLKNALLSSVSHDLRTPLAVITGAATAMLDGAIEDATRRELTETVIVESDRLNRLVRNLLDMTRLDAGPVVVRKEWQPVEEAVGAALARVPQLGGRPVEVDVPADLLVPVDTILLQQALVNLLENVARHTPADAPLRLRARVSDSRDAVEIEVADRGPGLPPGDEERVFEKFYGTGKGRGGGVGLGLTICRGIAVAHGGSIRAEQRRGGGAAFTLVLPLEGEPPAELAPEGMQG